MRKKKNTQPEIVFKSGYTYFSDRTPEPGTFIVVQIDKDYVETHFALAKVANDGKLLSEKNRELDLNGGSATAWRYIDVSPEEEIKLRKITR